MKRVFNTFFVMLILGLLVSFLPGCQQIGMDRDTSWDQDVFEADIGSFDFSDSEIESFAKVQVKFSEIQQEYSPRIEASLDPDQQKAIIEEANQKMIEVIKEEGLNIGTFNIMLAEAHSNPELMKNIEVAIDKILK